MHTLYENVDEHFLSIHAIIQSQKSSAFKWLEPDPERLSLNRNLQALLCALFPYIKRITSDIITNRTKTPSLKE